METPASCAARTAPASYPTNLGDLRRTHPDDPALITATAWASFASTRRIATWRATEGLHRRNVLGYWSWRSMEGFSKSSTMVEFQRRVVGSLFSVMLMCSPAFPVFAEVCGDADGNGVVTVTDGVQTLRAAASLQSSCTLERCDVDGSESITVTDGVNILRKAAGLLITESCPVDGAKLRQRVSEAYLNEFQLSVPRPAIYNDSRSVDCSGSGHLTTALYLRTGPETSRLYFMYMSRDGTVVTRRSSQLVLTPAGTFRTLTVVLRYPQTVGADALDLWQIAQAQINELHAAFAQAQGYRAPIVQFDNTNLLIDANEVADPRSFSGIAAAVHGREGVSDRYDFVMSINMDPSLIEGGFATPGDGFVYVGNYLRFTTTLRGDDWASVAAAAYLHEAAHHWGWPATHDWAPTCGGVMLGFEPFLVPPILFGWEDADGNHVPEILDGTP